MLFVLDNYDSFTYNLVQLFGELGQEPVVYRNDALTVEEVLALKPRAAVLSPGPCTPRDAGIMAMKHRKYPIYGVQFHPESIGTEHGKRLLENFLGVARAVP